MLKFSFIWKPRILFRGSAHATKKHIIKPVLFVTGSMLLLSMLKPILNSEIKGRLDAMPLLIDSSKYI